MSVLTPELQTEIKNLMAVYPKPRSAVLGALHRVQEELGWLPPEAQAEVAEIFEMPPAEVDSLVTFYYMYFRKPMGRYVFKVCRSISCYLRGSDRLRCHLQDKLGIQRGETTPDGMFSLLEGECLAACDGAPCIQINDRFVEKVTHQMADELVEECRKGSDRFPAWPVAWKKP